MSQLSKSKWPFVKPGIRLSPPLSTAPPCQPRVDTWRYQLKDINDGSDPLSRPYDTLSCPQLVSSEARASLKGYVG